MAENFENGLFEASHNMTELYLSLVEPRPVGEVVQVTVKHICGHTSQLFTSPDTNGAAEKAELEDQPCLDCENAAIQDMVDDAEQCDAYRVGYKVCICPACEEQRKAKA